METKDEILQKFIVGEIIDRPKLLKDLLIKNNKKLKYRNQFYEFKELLDDFINGHVSNRFLVLPGLRNTGKTTIIYQLYQYLLESKNIEADRILYISGELLNNYMDVNILEVVEYFVNNFHESSLMSLDKQLFIFVDEAQYDKKWSLAGKIIFDKTENIFMIFSGSSALNLEMNVDSARRLLKKPIYPLNYNELLYLKYDIPLFNTKSLEQILFTGDIENAQKLEKNFKKTLLNIDNFNLKEWNKYLEYGGFPSSFYEKNNLIICQKLNEMVNRIIEVDLNTLSMLNSTTKIHANRSVRFLALQKPGEISQNKLANVVNCSIGNISNILSILEKTYLIFHIEPYSSSSKRIRKSWKYYFATASLRNILNLSGGLNSTDINAYKGILAENLVAATLFNLSREKSFDVFFDSRKGGVDFILQTYLGDIIPIEVGYGKKSKKQIKSAVNQYNSNYGIIISNTTKNIKKKDNIIYIPLETFSLI